MIQAAAFLVTRNIKNRFMRSVSRIREPRYLVGAAAAALYFWTFFFRRHAAMQFGVAPPASAVALIVTVISFIALLILVLPWSFASTEPGLVFSEAEIQFFFPGPLSRRQILAYKIVRSQVQILFTAVIFRFFAFRGGHILGMWLALAVLDIYLTFVSFARARMRLSGIGWWPRAIAVVLAAVAIFTIASRQIEANAPLIAAAAKQKGPQNVIGAVVRTFNAPPLATVLYVPRLFGAVVYSATPMLPAVILAAAGLALFFVTTQLDVSFEDASIVASQRALSRRARMRGARSGRSTTAVNRMRPLFRLGERGRPEVALIWKNLIGATRLTSVPLFAIMVPLFVAAVGAIFHRREGLPELMGLMGLMTTGVLIFLGPRAVRTDLRTDILRLDVIKTFPLSAESLLIGELGASLLIVSTFEILLLVASVSILGFAGRDYFAGFTSPEFVVSALVFIIPITAIQLLIQNGAIILFPAWSVSTDDANRFSAMGQRLLMFIGNVFSLVIALLPAAILFLPSFWLMRTLLGRLPLGILIATIPAAAVLVVEIYVAVKFLAAQFEDIDIANDIDAVSS